MSMKNYLRPSVLLKLVSLLSLLSILSVIALTVVLLPSVKPLGFDYLGFLVGILAILVTALVGFQIFNYFAVVSRLESAEKVLGKFKSDLKESRAEILRNHYYCDATIEYVSTNAHHHELYRNENEDLQEYIHVYLLYCKCIRLFLLAENDNKILICIKNMDGALSAIIDISQIKRLPIPPGFDQKCDDFYSQIVPNINILEARQIELLHRLRARRVSISSGNPHKPLFDS